METHYWRVEWRYVLEEHGDQYVMTCGTTAMPQSHAVNWDFLELVKFLLYTKQAWLCFSESKHESLHVLYYHKGIYLQAYGRDVCLAGGCAKTYNSS